MIKIKCQNCYSCVIKGCIPYCYGVKEPFEINNIYDDCTEYTKEYWNTVLSKPTNDIDKAIGYFEKWIQDDLRELDGDTESDYAQFILDKHKHILTLLNIIRR